MVLRHKKNNPLFNPWSIFQSAVIGKEHGIICPVACIVTPAKLSHVRESKSWILRTLQPPPSFPSAIYTLRPLLLLLLCSNCYCCGFYSPSSYTACSSVTLPWHTLTWNAGWWWCGWWCSGQSNTIIKLFRCQPWLTNGNQCSDNKVYVIDFSRRSRSKSSNSNRRRLRKTETHKTRVVGWGCV